MEFEPWMLLVFPLFFGMGWLAARMDIKQLVDESSALPRSYFQGLNFLLNEQQDKAIDAFIEVVKVDPQTVELHFALGSLFRRRGEIDRALRMHLNLVERADLEPEKQQQALFELAQDYLKAGILDRAEDAFRQLLESSYARHAMEFLLELYQKEKDWRKAIEMAHKLETVSGAPQTRLIGFFYCEMAEEALKKDESVAAREHLNAALEADPNNARASILLGDIELTAGKTSQAVACWEYIEKQDAQYLPLVAERILSAYRQLEQADEGVNRLREWQEHYPSLDMMNVLFDAILQRSGKDAAYTLVRDELRRHPTLLGLDKLLEARLLEVEESRRADIEMVRELIRQRTRTLSMYRCKQCGFKARQFYWHCPACHGWETYPPRRSEENGLQI